MTLPPFPEGARLSVEESPEEVRVEWPVRWGPARRRSMIGFLLVAMAMLPALLLFGPKLAAHFGGMLTVSGLMPSLAFLAAIDVFVFFTFLLPMTQGTGNGLMVLHGDRLWLHRGGGRQILQTGKSSVASIAEEGPDGFRLCFRQTASDMRRLLFRSGLGYYFFRRGLKVSLPGPVEAKWVREVLARWRAG